MLFVHLNTFIYSFILQTFILHFYICSVLATDKRYGQSLTSVNFTSNRTSSCSLLQFCLSGLQVHVLWKCSVCCVRCGHTEAVSSHCTSWIIFAPAKPVLSSAVLPPAPSPWSSCTVWILCPYCVIAVCSSTSLLCTETPDSTGTEVEPLLNFPFLWFWINSVHNTGSL